MSIARTKALLDAHLQAIDGLPTLQLENTRFKELPAAFMRATILPAQSTVLTVGYDGQRQLQGLYQVDNFTRIDIGTEAAHAMADSIVDAFPIGLALTDGVITVRVVVASVMAANPLDKYYGVPVSVQWSVFS